MAAAAPTQNYQTGISLLGGIAQLVSSALVLKPADFTVGEKDLARTLVSTLDNAILWADHWFPDYSTVARDEAIKRINDMLGVHIPSATGTALIIKCYEVVNAALHANSDVVNAMGPNAKDVKWLILMYTSLSQLPPKQDYFDLLVYIWEWVTGFEPSRFDHDVELVTPPTGDVDGRKDSHPVTALPWLSNAAYCQSIAAIVKSEYTVDGRLTHSGQAYNVRRAGIIYNYLDVTTATSAQRAGLEKLLNTFKRPDWQVRPTDWEAITAAVDSTAILVKIDNLTEHRIKLRKATIYNYVPFRDGMDLLRADGSSAAYVGEGDATSSVNEDVFAFRHRAGEPWYPTETLQLEKGDEARFTHVADAPVLTRIIKNGQRLPDVPFSSSPVC